MTFFSNWIYEINVDTVSIACTTNKHDRYDIP